MSDSHVVHEMPCPACGYIIDRAASVDATQGRPDNAPGKGDFSVCFGCACILVFDQCAECGDLMVRLPVPLEAFELEDQHPEVATTLAQAQAVAMRRLAEETPGWRPPWFPPAH